MNMKSKLHIDFEARSELDLKKVGAYKYAAHPSTEILCMSYAFNDDPVKCVEYKKDYVEFTRLLHNVVYGKTVMTAFNAYFERCMFRFKMQRYMPQISIDGLYQAAELWKPQYWQCTMAKACQCGLTGSLDVVCTLLGIKEGKDKAGKRIMMKMCKPRKPRKAELADLKPGQILWHETPEDFEALFKYCNRDVEVERNVDRKLPRLPEQEQKIWEIDQRINDDGISVDMPRVNKAIHMMVEQRKKANTKIKYMTQFRVEAITQVAKIKKELERHKVYSDSLDAQHIEDLLKTDIPQIAKDILLLRKNNGKSSTAKYEAIRNREIDGKIHGLFGYHTATTGRWGSRGVQLHNLPRGNIKDIDTARFAFDHGSSNWMYPDTANLLSCLIRSMLVPESNTELCVADYAAIEARVLNWLAGQQNIVQKFIDYDGDPDRDVYIDMAEIIYQKKGFTKWGNPDERWQGKQTELGCGYMMAWKTFQTRCLSYGIEISEELARRSVKAYRQSHPKVVKLWYKIEAMAKNAIKNKGKAFHANGIFAKASDKFLRIKLLSDRFLFYYKPTIDEDKNIRFWGYDSQRHQVCRQYTYGGKLVENIVQGMSRDLLAHAMVLIEGTKYKTIIHVHDEIGSQVAEGKGDVDEFCKIVATLPTWANGCPVKAEGWIGKYYRKD